MAVCKGAFPLGGFAFLLAARGRWELSFMSSLPPLPPLTHPTNTMLFQRVPSARELFPLPTPTLGHFSTFPGLWPLSLRSMCVASTYKEALGDRISRIRRDSHMSSSSNWYSKLYTSKCHQEREKELGACFAFQHLPAGDRALCLGGTTHKSRPPPPPPLNPAPLSHQLFPFSPTGGALLEPRQEDRSTVAFLFLFLEQPFCKLLAISAGVS